MNETRRGNTSTFRTDINALRAFAVAVVVLYHANELWAGGGFVGVDIFFVISGFLMTRIIVSSHENKSFSFRFSICIKINAIFVFQFRYFGFSIFQARFRLEDKTYFTVRFVLNESCEHLPG